MAAQSHGHEILASYLVANEDPRYRAEIEALLHGELARFAAFGSSVRTLPQHRYLLLALALGDATTAIAVASLPIDRENWANFDSAYVYRICNILGVPQDAKLPKSRPTQTEQIFLEALDLIAEKRPYEPEKVQAFWRALRKKRYQFTILEHMNPFVPALETLSAV